MNQEMYESAYQVVYVLGFIALCALAGAGIMRAKSKTELPDALYCDEYNDYYEASADGDVIGTEPLSHADVLYLKKKKVPIYK